MKAIIAGAGPGGLAIGLYLHRIGWDVDICETVKQLEPLGVGINLLPHGTRELFVLGLAFELETEGIQTRSLEYRSRYGHLIYADPMGHYAGYDFPAYSIHRGNLQFILRDAFIQRVGPDSLHQNCHFDHFVEDRTGVTAYFIDKDTGAPTGEFRGDILVGADGIYSDVRRVLYPDEGPPQYEGIMMWRGANEQAPFLDGETMVIAGNHDLKTVIFPISMRAAKHGLSLVNWVAEVRFSSPHPLNPGDWTRPGTRDFIGRFEEFNLDFIDVQRLFADTETIYEYPMIDRDPVDKWSFGRVTLLGDAAHAMYPVGANGTSQAILDARALAESLQQYPHPVIALQHYEKMRLKPTNEVIRRNRQFYSEKYLDLIDNRMQSPGDKIENLISHAEIEEITQTYRKLAGFDVETLNEKGML